MNNAFLKFPFHFSEAKLLKDLHLAKNYKFTAHYNQNDYSGQWTSISLRSQNGEMDTIFALPQQGNVFKNTKLLDECLYFKEIVDSFKCEKESIRLLNLKPGSVIKEHTDYSLGYEDGVFRIHIPITTNDKVQFFINSEEVKMLPSECWYGNFNLPHSVSNTGETERVHLVMDCLRNEWSDALFLKMGYDFALENAAPQYSLETKLQMIEQLKLMDTEVSRELIAKLEKEIK